MSFWKNSVDLANKLKINVSWVFDRMVARRRATVLKDVRPLPDSRSLILAPHADDEWIGCSQIVKNNTNVLICNMNMPGGDSESMHKIRYGEMLALATMFRREIVTLSPESRKDGLLAILREYRPELVFLPFFMDWHDEHLAVVNVLKDVVNDWAPSSLVAMYPVSVPLPPRWITHFSALDKHAFSHKWETFKTVYTTQRILIPWRRHAANDRINGAFFKTYAAEVSSVMPVGEWLRCIEHRMLSDNQKHSLKNNLNHIARVRKLLQSFDVSDRIATSHSSISRAEGTHEPP